MYDPADATFNFPICLGAADHISKGMLKCVVWDEDLVKDDYLGEVGLRVEDWFRDPAFAFDEAEVRHFQFLRRFL
jgi:phosphatidylserine decarboxylase